MARDWRNLTQPMLAGSFTRLPSTAQYLAKLTKRTLSRHRPFFLNCGLPASATYALDAVDSPADLRPALARLLFKTAVVDDLEAARALVAELPDVTAVTRDGDLFGAHYAAGGSSAQQSLIEIQAAVDEASAALAEATATGERLAFEISGLEAGAKRIDAV